MPERPSHNSVTSASDILQFKPKVISSDFTAAAKFETLKIINSEWIAALSPAEFKLVMFIWQRTVYWGKQREVISLTHFMNGFCSRESGEVIQAGTGLSRKTILVSLTRMEESGLITRSRNQYGVYGYSLNFEWKPTMLREPKPKNKAGKGLKEPKGGGVKNIPSRCKKDTYKYENTKYAHKEEDRGSELPQRGRKDDSEFETEDLEELNNSIQVVNNRIQSAATASRAKREKKLERAAKSETVAGLEKLWSASLRKHHSECPLPVWSKVQCGKVKNFKNQYRKESGTAAWPFMEFCIANWHRIGKLRFQWLKGVDYPLYPDIDFLMGFKKHFLHLFSDEKFYERQLGLTSKEQEINKLKRMGYTPEQAEQAYKDSLEKSAAVTRHAERADIAERDVRALSAEKKNLERDISRMRIQRGRELIEQEKAEKKELNPGSKKKRKYDAEGFLISDTEIQDRF